jgi:hypothetical protein
MSLFRRRRATPEAPARSTVPGLEEAAAARGFQPATTPVFDDDLHRRIHEISRVLYGVTPKYDTFGTDLKAPGMNVLDAFRGTVDGRQVTFANAWSPVEGTFRATGRPEGTSVVVVELSTVLTLQGVEPPLKFSAFKGHDQPTGNAEFDRAYHVWMMGIPGAPVDLITTDVQHQILVRYDWTLAVEGTNLVFVGTGAFDTPAAAMRGVDEALAVVHALPASIAPDQVDHSFDDLLRRIDQLHSVEDGIAFLGTITDEERQQLAHSGTPLAAFADVRTPDEIGARFMDLDVNTRLQVMAMFQKATGQS